MRFSYDPPKTQMIVSHLPTNTRFDLGLARGDPSIIIPHNWLFYRDLEQQWSFSHGISGHSGGHSTMMWSALTGGIFRVCLPLATLAKDGLRPGGVCIHVPNA